MKKIFIHTLIFFTLLNSSAVKAQQPPANLLLTFIQIGSENSVSEEKISIYNPTNQAIDLKEYKITYNAYNSNRIITKLNLQGIIQPHETKQYASYNDEKQKLSSSFKAGFSSSGGRIAIYRNDQLIDDFVWNEVLDAKNNYVFDKTLVASRKNENEVFLDSDNYIDDFFNGQKIIEAEIKQQIEPSQSAVIPEISIDNYKGLSITEILPNPMAPEKDFSDEWIELYNNSTKPINLQNLKIRVESSRKSEYKITTSQDIQPNNYMILYSRDFNFNLPNNGATVSLLYNDQVIDQSIIYPEAKEGQSWSIIDSNWLWSAVPTPNAQNYIVSSSESNQSVNLNSESPQSKVNSPKNTGTIKNSTIKPTQNTKSVNNQPAKPTENVEKTNQPISQNNTEDSKPSIKIPMLLFGISVVIIYAIYEYRKSLAVTIRKLRGYYRNWKLYWAKFRWWRGGPAVK